MTAAHIVIMILFAIAMMYYTIKWQKRRNDSSVHESNTKEKRQSPEATKVEVAKADRHTHSLALEAALLAPVDNKHSLPKEIVNHYRSFFHTEEQIVSDIQTNASEISILRFPPAGKRGFWVTATCGLSLAGRRELLIYSYAKEEALAGHLEDAASEARRKFEETGQSVSEGDAFPLQRPIVPESGLTCLYAGHPLFEEESFSRYMDGVKVVRFLMLHAIAPDEYQYLRENGADALEALFVQAHVNSIDFFRKSTIEILKEKG